MFDTLKSKIYQGKQYIKDIKNAPIKEEFRGLPKIIDGECDTSICPTGALTSNPITIDMGKCTFCGACERACKNITFTNEYKLSSTDREKLIISPNKTGEDYQKTAIEVKKEIIKIFGHSLKLRQVSAGGCNGCEMELNACSNVNFDMGRFGIDFVASPRHADGIVITGPITENMAYALENCYHSVPSPKLVILCGTCAISGGVFQNSQTLNREFLSKYPIDLYIPGCPVHPLTFINGVLTYIQGK
ncbi:MAG: 4Fe-4S binding protein [Muribaculaceae bacterium]|nr:4Fe-4S binding protein [Muribaculaceae bacterium]